MAIVKAKFLPIRRSGGIYATNSLRYALERDSEVDNAQERIAFDGDRDSISALEALEEIEEPEGKYYYHLILNAGDGRSDVDLQDWTKETMANLENSLDEQGKGDNLKWMAVEHNDHADHDHVHVVLILEHKLDRDDLNDLREFTTESFDSRKDLIRELDFEMQVDKVQEQSQDIHLGQILDVIPSQNVTIASGSEDDKNKQRKQKQNRERGQDEGW